MRLLVLPQVLMAGAAAAAEPVDCDVIVNAKAPVELSYHEGDEASVLQVYRDASGTTVVWLKTMNGKFIAKGIFVDGILTTGETSSAACFFGFVNCGPAGTDDSNGGNPGVFVVAPRNSDGTMSTAGDRYPFYAMVTG